MRTQPYIAGAGFFALLLLAAPAARAVCRVVPSPPGAAPIGVDTTSYADQCIVANGERVDPSTIQVACEWNYACSPSGTTQLRSGLGTGTATAGANIQADCSGAPATSSALDPDKSCSFASSNRISASWQCCTPGSAPLPRCGKMLEVTYTVRTISPNYQNLPSKPAAIGSATGSFVIDLRDIQNAQVP